MPGGIGPNARAGGHTVRSVDLSAADVLARARERLAALIQWSRGRTAQLRSRVGSRVDSSDAAAYDAAVRDAFRSVAVLEPAPLAHASTRRGSNASEATRRGVLVATPLGPAVMPATEPTSLIAVPASEAPTPIAWTPRPVEPITARAATAPMPKQQAKRAAAKNSKSAVVTPALPAIVIDRPPTGNAGAPHPSAIGERTTASKPGPRAKPAQRRARASTPIPPGHEPSQPREATDVPVQRSRRRPGEGPLERLLGAQPGAASTAGDFFDGLVRKIESDR